MITKGKGVCLMQPQHVRCKFYYEIYDMIWFEYEMSLYNNIFVVNNLLTITKWLIMYQRSILHMKGFFCIW